MEGKRFFSSSQRADRSCDHPMAFSVDTGIFLALRRSDRYVKLTIYHHLVEQVKNAWTCNSNPSHAFIL
jgi:hypothetical protein